MQYSKVKTNNSYLLKGKFSKIFHVPLTEYESSLLLADFWKQSVQFWDCCVPEAAISNSNTFINPSGNDWSNCLKAEVQKKQILVKLFVQQLYFPICSEFVCLRASFHSERN